MKCELGFVFGAQDVEVLRIPVSDLLDDLAVAMAPYVASFGIKARSLEPASGNVRQACTAPWLGLLQKRTLKQNSGDYERAGGVPRCHQGNRDQRHHIEARRLSHEVTFIRIGDRSSFSRVQGPTRPRDERRSWVYSSHPHMPRGVLSCE